MNAFVIDAFEFCRVKERRDGEIELSKLPRLAEESVDKVGVIRWSLQGGSNSHGHPKLILSINGAVSLICQRCLTPFVFDIDSESTLVLARDEASADELDALLADEDVEVIVGEAEFNVAALIEDEALLAIPVSPKHETCPAGLVPESVIKEEKVSPFAVLKNLKQ
ncbi:MAG TPA: YceD family protein [Noviherbaspirillum sp.]|jgi:uncharacterized protein|uniref:YceD family protein n=1 Tax=Noviherbaspirillum sp. TaxID=1926288 RepID=UPI002DDCCDA1|nr:YceD family protein [Noviherbaspirillum sp.]HEV2612038.1 YceD family protein [Noviherbaspirillum sp.]